jgi:hypothetical protein
LPFGGVTVDGQIELWDLKKKKLHSTLKGFGGGASAVAPEKKIAALTKR